MAVQCPKCGSGVSEEAEECRICGNQMKGDTVEEVDPKKPGAVANGLPGLPGAGVTPSYIAMGSAVDENQNSGGEMKVSLTGEVIEVPRPPARPVAPSSSSAPKGGKSAPSGPKQPTRGRYGIPEEDAPEPKSVMSIIWTIAFFVIVVGGGGGWYFWNQKQQAPTKAAQKIGAALIAADWSTVADSIELSEDQKNQLKALPGGDDAKGMVKNQLTALGGLATFKEVTVGDQTMTGDSATVKVKMNIEGKGSGAAFFNGPKDVDWTLKNVNGIWKIDGESFNKGFRPSGP